LGIADCATVQSQFPLCVVSWSMVDGPRLSSQLAARKREKKRNFCWQVMSRQPAAMKQTMQCAHNTQQRGATNGLAQHHTITTAHNSPQRRTDHRRSGSLVLPLLLYVVPAVPTGWMCSAAGACLGVSGQSKSSIKMGAEKSAVSRDADQARSSDGSCLDALDLTATSISIDIKNPSVCHLSTLEPRP